MPLFLSAKCSPVCGRSDADTVMSFQWRRREMEKEGKKERKKEECLSVP